jgi:glycosyltransferase involved in cell wall biosynthesis
MERDAQGATMKREAAPLTKNPLVTIRLLTRNRRLMASQALRYALRQTYRPLEILVVDSGERRFRDAEMADGLFGDCSVRYLPVDKLSVGVLCNLAAKHARGDIIVHCDDDDWQSPTRVARQVAALVSSDAHLVQTTTFYAYHLCQGARFWPPRPDSLTFGAGGTFCHWRDLTESFPFQDLPRAQDLAFIKDLRAGGAHIHDMADPSLFVYTIHGRGNAGHRWLDVRTSRDALATVKDLMGVDFAFYEDLEDVLPIPERRHAFTGAPPFSGMVKR